MSYYRNRGSCQFGNCQCQNHILKPNTEICLSCNHGTCWHKKIKQNLTSRGQFYTRRRRARTGVYVKGEYVKKFIFCDKLENLPV